MLWLSLPLRATGLCGREPGQDAALPLLHLPPAEVPLHTTNGGVWGWAGPDTSRGVHPHPFPPPVVCCEPDLNATLIGLTSPFISFTKPFFIMIYSTCLLVWLDMNVCYITTYMPSLHNWGDSVFLFFSCSLRKARVVLKLIEREGLNNVFCLNQWMISSLKEPGLSVIWDLYWPQWIRTSF